MSTTANKSPTGEDRVNLTIKKAKTARNRRRREEDWWF